MKTISVNELPKVCLPIRNCIILFKQIIFYEISHQKMGKTRGFKS